MEERSTVRESSVEVEGLEMRYRECGAGEPVLLLHGWPTSSVLWRNLMEPLGVTHRVIAPDLVGFGRSAKPVDASYSFRFHDRTLEGLRQALGLDAVNLVVHDLGGPVGLYWAVQRPERVRRLALLNTLVYPTPSWAVVLFVLATRVPWLNAWMAGPSGIRFAMRFGTESGAALDDAALRDYAEPFEERDARTALLKAGNQLSPKGFREIVRKLPTLTMPVRLIYGENDRILPDVAKTMARLERDLPQATKSSLPGCGHFLQEDEPVELARMLSDFLNDRA